MIELNAKTILSLIRKKEQDTLFIFSLSRRLVIKLIVAKVPKNPISERFRKKVLLKKGLNITKFLMKIADDDSSSSRNVLSLN